MWKSSFVATSVAIGTTLDDALAAIDGEAPELKELVSGLRSGDRATRVTKLAKAVHTTVRSIDQVTLA